MGWYRATAPGSSPASPGSRRPPGSRRARPTPPGRSSVRGACVRRGRSPRTQSPASTSPNSSAPTTRRATSSSSSATTPRTRTSTTRHPTPLGRRTTSTAAQASTPASRARIPLAPTRSATTGPSPRAASTSGQDFIFNAEYPMIRWLERNGYDVSYETGVDTDRYGSLIQNHGSSCLGPRRVLVRPAARQRRGRARRGRQPGVLQRQRGVLEDALGAQRPPHARLVTRRRTTERAPIDPTGCGRAPGATRARPPADGVRPENELTGQIFTVNAGTTRIQVPRPIPTASLLAPHARSRARAARDAGDGHAGLRVGLRRSTTAAAAARRFITACSTTDRRRRRRPEVLQDTARPTTAGHRDPQPDALPRAQRRAGLRRRHGPVVVGPRPRARPRRGPRAIRACSRRRSICSPTWACSPRHARSWPRRLAERRSRPSPAAGPRYRHAPMPAAVKTTVTELPESRVRVEAEVPPEEVERAHAGHRATARPEPADARLPQGQGAAAGRHPAHRARERARRGRARRAGPLVPRRDRRRRASTRSATPSSTSATSPARASR